MQRVRSIDLFDEGIVREVVEECGETPSDPLEFCARIAAATDRAMRSLNEMTTETRRARRLASHRALATGA